MNAFNGKRRPRHFILMLTVRNQIGAGRYGVILSRRGLQGDSKVFFERCSAINAIPTGEKPGADWFALMGAEERCCITCYAATSEIPICRRCFFPRFSIRVRKYVRMMAISIVRCFIGLSCVVLAKTQPPHPNSGPMNIS